jgi:hypothetical protein
LSKVLDIELLSDGPLATGDRRLATGPLATGDQKPEISDQRPVSDLYSYRKNNQHNAVFWIILGRFVVS